MLNVASGFAHIYLATGYTDLRCGIEGLAAIVKNDFHLDPYETGNLFLFCGRSTNRIKALLYEGDGFVLLYKRIAGDGRFQPPRNETEVKDLTPQQYRWLMDGLAIEQRKAIRKVKPVRI